MIRRARAVRPPSSLRLGLGVATILLVVAGCTGAATPASSGPTPAPGALKVVATTTVLADMVRQVGGTNVDVTSIVPKGARRRDVRPLAPGHRRGERRATSSS